MFFSLLQLCFLFDYEFLSDFINETTNSFIEENFMTEMEHNEKRANSNLVPIQIILFKIVK